MTNAEIAHIFTEIADLLEIKGEDSFRVSSYRRIARSIQDLATDVATLAATKGGLEQIPGVGKSSAEKIVALLETGRIPMRDDLLKEIPDSLLPLLKIPGMGPKKVAVLWKEREIRSLDDLKRAIDAGGLDRLAGFGGKTVEKIREGIAFLGRSAGRTRLGVAMPIAESFRQAVALMKGVERVEIAGSLRRGAETIGDIDLLCVAKDGAKVVQQFCGLAGVSRVLVAGDTKGSIVAPTSGGEVQVDLRVVPAESFGAAWQYFTGSKEHNVRLREMAVKKGWTLNEYALAHAKSGKPIASESEEDIYAALGVPCVPPELREDRGELALKESPPGLITLSDLRGDLHMHTTASDGKNSIHEMARAAAALGYQYICITDHSKSSTIANGLTEDRLQEHIDAIRAVNDKMKGLSVWAGAEVDILADGSLDYAEHLLKQLDWVVASNHYHLGRDGAENTQRALAALHNPYVNLLAHPTGRMLGKRDAAPIDIEAIARAAAETGTALEINASSYRLDLRDQSARLAASLGAKICIDCDAHSVAQLEQMRFGVMTARRAWLRGSDVVNSWAAKEVRAFVAKKRKLAR